MDASGNLYGTTLQRRRPPVLGTVFELVNSRGTYSERVLYSFTYSGGDGAAPYGGLIMDASGNLYGTTSQVVAPPGLAPYSSWSIPLGLTARRYCTASQTPAAMGKPLTQA